MSDIKERRESCLGLLATEQGCISHLKFESMMRPVAEQFLAEHKEDDDEPVTPEWLMALGFEPMHETSNYLHCRRISYVAWLGTCLRVGCSTTGWTDVGADTKGKARRLFEAMKVK